MTYAGKTLVELQAEKERLILAGGAVPVELGAAIDAASGRGDGDDIDVLEEALSQDADEQPEPEGPDLGGA